MAERAKSLLVFGVVVAAVAVLALMSGGLLNDVAELAHTAHLH